MGKGIKRIYICSMLNEFDGKFMFKKKNTQPQNVQWTELME